AEPADDTPSTGRGCLLGRGQPGRYYGRAGYRGDIGGGRSPSVRALRSRRPICLPACAGWLSVHGRRHSREVSPLLRGVRLQPLSGPLQAGLRFLPGPLAATPSARLTTRFPLRGGYGPGLSRWKQSPSKGMMITVAEIADVAPRSWRWTHGDAWGRD